MKTKDFNWKALDDLEIYGKYWCPESNIKAVICLVHGMGEHINRYNEFAAAIVKEGYAVIGFDQRGHGKSKGQRGHTPSYEHLLHTVDDLLNKAEEFFPEIPKILMGHSMGGNVVLNYALNREPKIVGVIASSPLLRLAFDPPAWKTVLGNLVKNIFPSLPQFSGLDSKAISRIPEEVAKYNNDKLVHDSITPGMYFGFMEKGEYALAHAAEFPLPLLIYHGTKDQLTSHIASKEFAEKLGTKATLQLFEGGYHETHHDHDKDKAIALICQWLQQHVKA
jgi:alpha-beta hydrolase superfamily lysophospholipase